ncbi:hypothetical protein CROQUDRAFT_599470 [Cronartium quercuum f. sp. fusiforme G11]|uniref:Uncharacterized protein n=1 Tax=Cronartium quercuum f. sp. fusiforme G11 TaxID=708437 RepID=A0A9P6NSZ6_9BASI|nr:hypothetical protein CROQUDRAFT_599470 [Cronartium quercuum f. sp. fusiforme G11]
MGFTHFRKLITVCFATLALSETVSCARQRSFHSQLTSRTHQHSSVVVFGASWADNAHPRPQKYAWTLKRPPYYGGRYSNGIIWAEYLTDGLLAEKKIPQFNYAYGGAVANNDLTYTNEPDTKMQSNQYISEVKNGTLNRGSGPVLHVWWIGINQMTQIWTDAIKKDPTMKQTETLENANFRVDQQITKLESQLARVRSEYDVNNIPCNYLLLPIPPLETVLRFQFQAVKLARNDAQLAKAYLNFVAELSHRYNEGILRLVSQLDLHLVTTGWVRTFDFESLWRSVIATPSEYGLEIVHEPCLQLVNGLQHVCSFPDKYLFWDTVHPTTAMHKIMAQKFLAIINS